MDLAQSSRVYRPAGCARAEPEHSVHGAGGKQHAGDLRRQPRWQLGDHRRHRRQRYPDWHRYPPV